MSKTLAAWVCVGAIGFAAVPAPAHAQSQCTAAKHQAAGTYARALEACRAKAVKKDAAIDSACLAKALEKLERSFDKAGRKDDCLSVSEEGLVSAMAQLFAEQLDTVLDPGGACCTNASTCIWAPSATACEDLGGLAGPVGSVCDATGNCVIAPITAGPCCDISTCSMGDVTAGACDTGGGSFTEEAVCVGFECVAID